jgi:hypothetical protein
VSIGCKVAHHRPAPRDTGWRVERSPPELLPGTTRRRGEQIIRFATITGNDALARAKKRSPGLLPELHERARAASSIDFKRSSPD